MADREAPRRIPLLLALVFAGVTVLPATSSAVTRAQVDRACEDSKEQLAEYRAATQAFEEAALAYEAILNEVDRLERKQDRIQGQVDNQAEDLLVVQDKLESTAVELYMMGGLSNPGIILSASSVDEFLTTTVFLSSAAEGGQESIDDLLAAKSELGRFQVDLDVIHGELKVTEGQAADLTAVQQEAMEREQAAYAKLSGECKTLTAKYEAEQAAARARARSRASGTVAVGSFNCPFTPGRTSFINSWGFPRSGGRTHKGTDMFAAWNEPMYAVQSGTAYITNGGLGGKGVWLVANSGIAYYYAHLSGWNISNGQKVSQGQTVGFNGNSGNASGGSPHLHFEIHPGGRGSAAVNPYPTLVAACK